MGVGLTAVSLFTKIASRREEEKQRIEEAEQARDRAREVADDQADKVQSDYARSTEGQAQEIRKTQTVSEGIEEGTSASAALKTNQQRVENLQGEIIQEGEREAKKYEDKIKNIRSSAKMGILSDVVGSVGSAVKTLGGG